MILRTVRLEHWGAMERVELTLDSGANLLHGPNGSGKSTVVGAICRGLFDRHDSRAAELLAVRPWGTCLAPSVQLELETGGEVYRLHKQFLEEPSCRLERRQTTGWRLLADGKQADRAILALLEAPGSKSGASKPRDRGISQLLWALQGDVDLPATLSGETGYALRQSAGQLLEGPAARRVALRLEKAHQETFRANGTHRKGSIVSELRDEIERLTRQRDALTEQIATVAGRRERAASQAEALAQAQVELAGLKTQRASAAEALGLAESHRQRRREAELAYEAIEVRWRELQQRCDGLADCRTQAARVEQRLADAREQLTLLRAELAEQSAQTERLEQRAKQQRAAWDLVRGRQRELEARADLRSAEARMGRLSSRIARASELTCWIQAKQQERELLDAPPLAVSQQLEALRGEPTISLSFTALAALELTIEVDGQTVEVALDAGQQHALKLTGQASLELPGIGRVEVTTALRDQLQALEQQCGGRTLVELAQAAARDQALVRELEQLEAELRGLTPGGLGALDESLRQLQLEMSRLAPVDPLGPPGDPQQIASEATAAEQQFDETARAHLAAAAQLAQRTAARAELASSEASSEASLAHLQADLARLTADGLSDAERREALEQAQGQLAAAQGRKQELAQSREQIETVPERRVAGLDQSISRAEAQLGLVQAEVHQLKGELGALLDEQAAAQLPAVQAQLQEATRRLERESLRADGLALLYSRYLVEREASIEQVLDPISGRVMSDLAQLGQPLRRLALDRDLGLDRLEVERGVPLAAEGLSHGTWVQLVTLIRLNLGELLSAREPQLVILDDTLVHSDAQRMSRMMSRLAQAAEHLQLLLVTCQPEQFESLAARRIELSELSRTPG